MKLNEKAIVDYLERNAGKFMSSWQLVSITNASNKSMEDLTTVELFEMDEEVFNIGRRNGFYLSKRHHWFEELGMPWHIDFEIIRNVNNYFEDRLAYGSYVRYQGKIMIVFDETDYELAGPWNVHDRFFLGTGYVPEGTPITLIGENDEYVFPAKRDEIELLKPYCADQETVRKLFRLEVMAWELAKEGKYPFVYDSDSILIDEQDFKCFYKRLKDDEVYDLDAWHKAFIEMKFAFCQKETEPGMTIGTLWSIFQKDLGYLDMDESTADYYLSWLKIYEANKNKPLSEIELDEKQKKEFCDYMELYDRYPSAEQIKAYRKFLDKLVDSGERKAIETKAWGSYGGNELLECDWKEAERCLLKMYEANVDKANAANALGYIYYSNRLGEPDYEKAFRFFSEAAKEDITEAKYKLADMYRKGHGTEKDTDKAFRTYMKLYNWQEAEYEKGAVNDLADIALRLGYCYENGEGVGKDLIKARYYFVKAEEAVKLRINCGGKFGDEVVFNNIQKALERTKQ